MDKERRLVHRVGCRSGCLRRNLEAEEMPVIHGAKKVGYQLHKERTLGLASMRREKQLEGNVIGGVLGKL